MIPVSDDSHAEQAPDEQAADRHVSDEQASDEQVSGKRAADESQSGEATTDADAVASAVRDVSTDFELIVAVAANEVIGADGEIPWHIPEDLERFKRLTTGHPVVMGRRTYQSIVAQLGEPLPDRTSVVLSRSSRSYPEGAIHAEDVPTAVRLAATDAQQRGVQRAFVAGGESVYRAFLPVATRLHRTELAASYEGDTRFPAFDEDHWRVTDRTERDGFAFVTYDHSERTDNHDSR